MPNLDFSLIQLPNLLDHSVYPDVSHGPSCSDDPPDEKSCHATPVVRLRQYALPTEPLGVLKFPWNTLRELIPAAPPLGVHCPTIEIDHSQDGASLVGDAAQATLITTIKNGDACLPQLLGQFVFPCTSIQATVSLSQGFPATASWAPPVNVRDNNQCIQQLQLLLRLPGCTTLTSDPSGNAVQMVSDPADAGLQRTITDQSGVVGQCLTNIADLIKVPCIMPTMTSSLSITPSTAGTGSLIISSTGPACARRFHVGLSLSLTTSAGGGSTSGGGFTVGTVADHAHPFGSAPCAAGYSPGAEVPVVDTAGVLGTAGAALDPLANRVVNFTNDMLVTGDTVELIQCADQPGPRIEWRIV